MTISLLIVSADTKFAQVLLHGLEQEGYRVQITRGKGESVVRADEEHSSLAFLDMDLGYRADHLPIARDLAKEVLSLPIGPHLDTRAARQLAEQTE